MNAHDHKAALVKALNEAAILDTHLETDTTGEASDGQVLMMYAGTNRGGYLIEVRHVDAETAQAMNPDVIEWAEHAAGWDPTP